MCKLSKREEEILTMLRGATPGVVAECLGISEKSVSTYRTRVRRKEAQAKAFLEYLDQFKDVLHPERQYKGLRVATIEEEEEF